jgi:hypothetical protein
MFGTVTISTFFGLALSLLEYFSFAEWIGGRENETFKKIYCSKKDHCADTIDEKSTRQQHINAHACHKAPYANIQYWGNDAPCIYWRTDPPPDYVSAQWHPLLKKVMRTKFAASVIYKLYFADFFFRRTLPLGARLFCASISISEMHRCAPIACCFRNRLLV